MSLTCTKKKPIPDKLAAKLAGNSLVSVCHPDAVSTRHDAVNQRGEVVGVFWKHACPHCKEEWQSHGVVSLEAFRKMDGSGEGVGGVGRLVGEPRKVKAS